MESQYSMKIIFTLATSILLICVTVLAAIVATS